MDFKKMMNEVLERGVFGTKPFKLVRKQDPATSHQAAEKVDTAKMEYLVYEAIHSFGENGCISDEVLEKFPYAPYSTITARYRALHDKGYIEIIGVRKGRSGKNQRVMRAV